MQRIVRAIPVKSREALMAFRDAIEQRDPAEKNAFLSRFGDGVEEWYYQEIEGQAYVIAIAEGSELEAGFEAVYELGFSLRVGLEDALAAVAGALAAHRRKHRGIALLADVRSRPDPRERS